VQAFRKEFALPNDVEPLAIISIGHYGEAEKLEPVLRDREKAERTRSAVGEIAYEGAWKHAFKG